jgi:hypothetical protein
MRSGGSERRLATANATSRLRFGLEKLRGGHLQCPGEALGLVRVGPSASSLDPANFTDGHTRTRTKLRLGPLPSQSFCFDS